MLIILLLTLLTIQPLLTLLLLTILSYRSLRYPFYLCLAFITDVYTITRSMRAFWLVNQLWFIVPVNPWKNPATSQLLYKSNRPEVPMVYGLINHLGCWKNTRRIRKSLACGSWLTNSSCVLPLSHVVYQPINHRNLWSIV